MITRRSVLGVSAGAAFSSLASPLHIRGDDLGAAQSSLPDPIAKLPSFAGKVAPFTNQERLARINRAKELMDQQKIQAIVLGNSTSNTLYFANIRMGGSERMWALVISAKARPFVVCPAFERDRAAEMLEDTPFPKNADVLMWEEDESPFAHIIKALRDGGISGGAVGLDENMKFTFSRMSS